MAASGCCGRWPATRPGLQIMYGLAGERRLAEYEVPWLPGYEGSQPVRVGNAAHDQFQLDVYGEVCDALHHARLAGPQAGRSRAGTWSRRWSGSSSAAWDEPDEGIWEVRGPRRHFTHSKVMAWVAFDRAIKSAERFELDGPARRVAAGAQSDPRPGLPGRVRPEARTRSSSRSGRSCSTPAC